MKNTNCKSATPDIDFSEAIILIANRCYTDVLFANGERTVLTNHLGHIEKLLPESNFFRCHIKYLVNRRYIVSIDAVRKHIQLSNNQKIPISHRKLPELINWYF